MAKKNEKKLNVRLFSLAELSAVLLTTKRSFDREGWLSEGPKFVIEKCLNIVETKIEGYDTEEQKIYIANNIALFCLGESNIFDQYYKES